MSEKENRSTTSSGLEIVYDSECPICNQFASSIEGADNVTLVDGRKPSALRDEIESKNLDIDKGIVVRANGKLLHGTDAFHYVATHVKGKGFRGVLSRRLLRHRFIASITYPTFVLVRRILLKLLGKPLINGENKKAPGSPCQSISVYYNSACPVCNAGIKHQKVRMETIDVSWKDIHTDAIAAQTSPGDIDFIRKRLHVIDAHGRLHIGIDAFITLWRASPGEAWKANLLSIPVVHAASAFIYNGFAYLLYRYNRWVKHW